jgi:RNA polymerase sigma factor (sigma-70 family)
MPLLASSQSSISDAELISGVLRKEESAFRTLYRRHTPHILPLVLRMLDGREDEAEDVVQDTWIAATNALAGFRGEATFRTWITGIAINRCRAALRTRGRWADLDEAQPPIARAIPHGMRIDLERAVALLAPGYRAVLILHDVEGYTHEEIGTMLDVAPGTSKAQLHHARRALRALLEPKREEKADVAQRR